MRYEKTRQAIVTITASALLAAGLVVSGPATTGVTAPPTLATSAPASAASVEAASIRKERLQASRSSTRNEPPQNVVVKKKVQKVEKKKAVKPAKKSTNSSTKVRSIASNSGANRAIGRKLAAQRGWTGDQWTCLNNLWTKESGWRHTSDNPSSSAYGIPQALPGSKMKSAGSDWRTNPATQIKWGLGYIKGRYGTPCSAWRHFLTKNWY